MRWPVVSWERVWDATTEGALDLLMPAVCAVCGGANAHGRGIACVGCRAGLVPLGWPLCERCGHPRLSPRLPLPPGASAGACRWCERLAPGIRAVRSACRMDDGQGAAFVHALKYDGWQRLAEPMGEVMSRLSWPTDVESERRALVPLPLGASRRRERGFNQAELLARRLALSWGCELWNDVLIRERETASQVRLTPSDRSINVSRAFVVPASRRATLRGQHLVLVDDVVTTAATLNAAAEALFDGGARIISCITFGRAPDPGDRAVPDSDFFRM